MLHFHPRVQAQFHATIKILWSRAYHEYKDGKFASYLSANCIIHQTSFVQGPEQNESLNEKMVSSSGCSILLCGLCMVPSSYGGDVVLIAECYKSSALSYCYKYSNIKKQINIIKTYSSTQPSFVPFIFNIEYRSLLILQKVSCMHLVYLALKLVRHKFNEDIDK